MYVLSIETVVAVTVIGLRLCWGSQINMNNTVLSFNFFVVYRVSGQRDNHPQYFYGHCREGKYSSVLGVVINKSLSVRHETKQKTFTELLSCANRQTMRSSRRKESRRPYLLTGIQKMFFFSILYLCICV